MKGPVPIQDTMASDTEPSNTIKLLHLLFLSTSWGMQFWVTFVAGFVMSRHLPRHTFGSIQRQLFPYYFHISCTCAFLNLTLFAMSHGSERLGEEHTSQLIIFFICIIASVLNAQCFGQATSASAAELQQMERGHGLGQELGLAASEPRRQLRASNPSYRQLARHFALCHALSSLCNLLCVVCNALSLWHLAAQLPAL
ncbi:transmembrane protein 205 [Parus major]|uniref:transmembrane protein 205 n=1 Tax=Parus major TaxID=9157 RepID=UPI0007713090|nr:transmembrane protein 205 [Parus major]XP_033372240.1 transmembrane protein 205 [Parus major]